MWPIQRTRKPLYGRFNLTLPVFPFCSGGFPLVRRHTMRTGVGNPRYRFETLMAAGHIAGLAGNQPWPVLRNALATPTQSADGATRSVMSLGWTALPVGLRLLIGIHAENCLDGVMFMFVGEHVR
jgi:hypothetical protein